MFMECKGKISNTGLGLGLGTWIRIFYISNFVSVNIINMGIQPVLIYVISSLEPKFHWDGMKNELSTYVYLNMGKFQVRARLM